MFENDSTTREREHQEGSLMRWLTGEESSLKRINGSGSTAWCRDRRRLPADTWLSWHTDRIRKASKSINNAWAICRIFELESKKEFLSLILNMVECPRLRSSARMRMRKCLSGARPISLSFLFSFSTKVDVRVNIIRSTYFSTQVRVSQAVDPQRFTHLQPIYIYGNRTARKLSRFEDVVTEAEIDRQTKVNHRHVGGKNVDAM